MTVLRLSFADEVSEVLPGGRITFGRKADIEIDSSRYLHRVVGAFEWADENWWLINKGTAIVLELADRTTASRVSVAPGAAVHVSFSSASLRFEAGPSPYELLVEQTEILTPHQFQNDPIRDDLTSDETVTASSMSLNDEQRLLLAGLAQRRLRDRNKPKSTLATNREVTDALGWTKKKFDHKLDNLCVKFAKGGVPGLTAREGGTAGRRREELIDYVLMVGLIGEIDLVDYERARETVARKGRAQ